MQSREQKLAAAKRRLEKLKKARTASSAAGGQTPLEDPHSPNSEYRSGHDGSEVDHTDLQQTKIDPGQSSPFGKPPQLSLARGSSSSLSRLEVNTTRSQTFAMQQGSPMRSSSATESLRRLSVNSTSDVSGLSTDEVLAQNSVLRSQVTTLTAENASMLKKLKDLEQLAQGFRYEQAAVKSKYASFEQSIQELRSRLATKEVVIQQQQHERDSLKIKLAELEAAAVPRVEGEALMQKQIEDLPSKLENSKSESKGFFSDVSIREASALPDGAEAEIEALKNELAAAKLEAARGTERVQSLTTEVAFLSEAKQQLESEVEAAKSELTLLRNGTPVSATSARGTSGKVEVRELGGSFGGCEVCGGPARRLRFCFRF
ncbi:hypothetical protein DFJ73DRAFT_377178 [Zopfochytrium polystomum]|nr:hypothetical protein DFJ73DRAFT_377178 [Zopfochytrium polystomum]